MKYTEDQEKALEDMLKWYKSPVKTSDVNTLLYVLSGAAGTGKTTIVKKAIQELGLRPNTLAVTAPTHQAKKVIQQATDFPAYTIQKLLGLRPNVEMDNFDINNPQFDPLGEPTIQYYKVVMIDESSMLNSDSFDFLVDRAKRYGVRIIFIGDSFQLPPIGEVKSKVFTSVVNRSNLLTVVRQGDDNPNTDMLLNVRKDIKDGTETFIKSLPSLENNIHLNKGFKILNSNDYFRDALNLYRSTESKFDLNHIRMLSWTNKSVERWSTGIRTHLSSDEEVLPLYRGENLIGYTTIQDRRADTITLQNSATYKVLDIVDDETNWGIPSMLVTLYSDEGEEFMHHIVKEEGMEDFCLIIFDKWKAALAADYRDRGRRWAEYFNCKNHHLLLRNVNYNGMKMTKDLYYGYAMTVHKSQGSTFTNTAVNLVNIAGNRTLSERNRLLYVALSRCKNMNLILAK